MNQIRVPGKLTFSGEVSPGKELTLSAKAERIFRAEKIEAEGSPHLYLASLRIGGLEQILRNGGLSFRVIRNVVCFQFFETVKSGDLVSITVQNESDDPQSFELTLKGTTLGEELREGEGVALALGLTHRVLDVTKP